MRGLRDSEVFPKSWTGSKVDDLPLIASMDVKGHIKEVREKWFDPKTGKFKRPDGYTGQAPDVTLPRITIPNR